MKENLQVAAYVIGTALFTVLAVGLFFILPFFLLSIFDNKVVQQFWPLSKDFVVFRIYGEAIIMVAVYFGMLKWIARKTKED